MTYVVVGTEVSSYMTRQPDPTDDWDCGDTEGHVENVTATLVQELQPYYGDSLGKEFPDHVGVGTTLYAVVADYTDGCTFGRTGCQGKVVDVFEDPDEAAALARVAHATTDYSFTHNGKEYSANWVGYFEHLQALDVWAIVVNGASSYPGASGPGFRRGH